MSETHGPGRPKNEEPKVKLSGIYLEKWAADLLKEEAFEEDREVSQMIAHILKERYRKKAGK